MQRRFFIVFTLALIISGILICTPLPGHAASESVVINEVLYDPTGTDLGYEWIELTNRSQTPIDLTGWQIQIAGNSFATVFTFPNGTVLAPSSFLTIGESSTTANIKVSSLGLQNGGSSSDGVRIINNQSQVIDTLIYDDNNLANLPDDSGQVATEFAIDVASGYSLCRLDTIDTDSSKNDFITCTNPTLGTKNTFPALPEAKIIAPTKVFQNSEVEIVGVESASSNGDIVSWEWLFLGKTYTEANPFIKFETIGNQTINLKVTDEIGLSHEVSKSVLVQKFDLKLFKGLIISEVFPSPKDFDANKDKTADSNDEFIEITNISTAAISLAGLYLADESTFESPALTFDDILLKPGQSLVVFKETTKLNLNNDKDSVFLMGPANEIIDKLSYTSSKYDISVNSTGSNTFTNAPTPGRLTQAQTLATTGLPHPILQLLKAIIDFYKSQKYDMLGMFKLVYTTIKWQSENQLKSLQNQQKLLYQKDQTQ